MSYPTGAVSRLTNDLTSYVGMDLTTDRQNLVTARSDTRVGIWMGDGAAARGTEILAPFPYSSALMTLAWAGERLLYDSTTNGGSIMGLTPGKGGPVEAVSSAYGPSATSDGRTIVFGGVSDVGLWKMDSASRGKTLQLVSGLMLASIVTPDSRHVVFLSVRSGVQSPWIVPIEGGEPTQITNTFAGIGT